MSLGKRQNAVIVRGLASSGDNFVAVGGNAHHAAQHRFGRRRSIVVVIRQDQATFSAKALQTGGDVFGTLDLDVDSACSGVQGSIENPDLIFHAAVEFAMVLVAAAGGENA